MFFNTLPFQLPPTGSPWDASRATPMFSSFHMPDVCCPTLAADDLYPQHMLPLVAAQVGGWLEQLVPPQLNAAMMPMAWPSPHGWPVPARAMAPMPPVLQGALPVLGPGMNAAHVIGALQGLCERNVTDVVVAHGGGRALPPLLALLDRPGAVCRCELPSPGGWVTGSVTRHPLPQEDGHWLMEIELSQAGRRMQSQWIRVHEARADPLSPQNFHGDMARVFEGFTRRLERGEHAQMSTFCEDGATRSGAAIALMHAMGRQRALDAVAREEREGRDVRDVRDVRAPMPTSHDRAEDSARFLEAARTHRGPAFAQGQEGLINATAARTKSPPANTDTPRLDASVPAEVPAELPEPMKPVAARPAVSQAQVPATRPPPPLPDPAVVAHASPRRRVAPPDPHPTTRKRPATTPQDARQIEAALKASQERRVARSPHTPNTPLSTFDGTAKAGRADPAQLERALAKARNETENAARARSNSAPTTVVEPWEILSLPSDGDGPAVEERHPTSAPQTAGTLRRAASDPTLDRSASGTTPGSQSTAPPLRRMPSEPDLRQKRLDALAPALALAAQHAVGGLLGEPISKGGLLGRLGRLIKPSGDLPMHARLEKQLPLVVEKLCAEYALQAKEKAKEQADAGKQDDPAESVSEQEFVISHLARHLVDAMTARPPAERAKLFKAIEGRSAEWLNLLGRRQALLRGLENITTMSTAKFNETREGYRSMDYGIEAMQQAHRLLWPTTADAFRGEVNPPAAPPEA